jgi:hypothetical protein
MAIWRRGCAAASLRSWQPVERTSSRPCDTFITDVARTFDRIASSKQRAPTRPEADRGLAEDQDREAAGSRRWGKVNGEEAQETILRRPRPRSRERRHGAKSATRARGSATRPWKNCTPNCEAEDPEMAPRRQGEGRARDDVGQAGGRGEVRGMDGQGGNCASPSTSALEL